MVSPHLFVPICTPFWARKSTYGHIGLLYDIGGGDLFVLALKEGLRLITEGLRLNREGLRLNREGLRLPLGSALVFGFGFGWDFD